MALGGGAVVSARGQVFGRDGGRGRGGTETAAAATVRRFGAGDRPGKLFVVGDPQQSLYGFRRAAIEMYAEAFDAAGALDRLEAFASFNGADFYGLPRNTDRITLKREAWTATESFSFGEAQLKPLRAGETLPWKLA